MKRFDVSTEWRGSRLDRFIRAHLPGTPFGVTQILLRKGLIFLNGTRAGGSARLQSGDVVAVDIHEADENGIILSESRFDRRRPVRVKRRRPPGARNAAPNQLELFANDSDPRTIAGRIAVLYEDDHVLVIDKPAGMVVQPGNRAEKGSLLNVLAEMRRMRRGDRPPRTIIDEPPAFPYTPVHRLDRGTGGCLIVAKTRPAARSLAASFAARLVRKTYLAVVEGSPAESSGTIDLALDVSKGKASHAIPHPSGKPAETSWAVDGQPLGANARLLVRIGTGRTHQIRAHLASIGHPIVGDREYGAADRLPDGRIMLFAASIEFPHPATGEPIAVTAKTPSDFGE